MPSGEGLDLSQISAAVGAVIFGNSTTGLLKNISRQGTLVVVWPGKPIVMTPPHVHMQVHVLFSAGIPPIMQLAEPGVQGVVVTGTQGIGVNTPRAAAVAEATAGLAIDMHMPKGGMFVIGTKSMMFAAGVVALTLLTGKTLRADGAIPNEHIITAPAVTWVGM